MVIASYGNPIFSVQVGWLATGRHPGLNDLYKKEFRAWQHHESFLADTQIPIV